MLSISKLQAVRAKLSGNAAGGSERVLQLDILRGIAILLVIGGHALAVPGETHYLRPATRVLSNLGWTGVDLFFVLSGFLIGGILFREIRKTGHLNVRRFLIRRGLKIWPSYLIYLVYVAVFMLYLAIKHHIGTARGVLPQLLPNLLHVQNYFGSPRGHTWTLAVEEHFYLLLPFLLLFLVTRQGKQDGMRHLPVVAIGVMLLCTAIRCVNAAFRPPFCNYEWTHTRLDGLFFGVLLAYAYHYKPAIFDKLARFRGPLFTLGLLLISPMAFLNIYRSAFVTTLGFNFLTFGYGFILIASVTTPVGEGFTGRLMQTRLFRGIAVIGFFSYPIYLWHEDAGDYLVGNLAFHLKAYPLQPDLRWLAVMALYIAVAFWQGAVFSLLIERPTLALREKWFPIPAAGLIQNENAENPPMRG